jgi:hypothetical protein
MIASGGLESGKRLGEQILKAVVESLARLFVFFLIGLHSGQGTNVARPPASDIGQPRQEKLLIAFAMT